jgi:hypothetical protein
MDNSIGQYQSSIAQLPKLQSTRYENIFKVYFDKDGVPLYNLNKSINFPNNLDPALFNIFIYDSPTHWPILSYKLYETIYLWWLVTEVNNIRNPFILPPVGTTLKYIKPEYIQYVLGQIKTQLV